MDTVHKLQMSFEPSADRARNLDMRMRARLASSLKHIFEQSHGLLGIPAAKLTGFLEQLTAKPISPLAFALYSELVFAIERDEMEEASQNFRLLLNLPEHASGPRVLNLPDSTSDPTNALYARMVDSDPETPFAIFPAPALAEDRCRANIEAAFDLMHQADPDQEGELRGILREIVLAVGTDDKTALTFDGASSFLLWGGIIINADRDDGPVGMVQMLAHEGAHNVLFGLCMDSMVVENGPDERYASPLRKDPRPLEGIFHATFVIARMYRSLSRLIQTDILSPADHQDVLRDLSRQRRNFEDGISTLRRHARLTQRGTEILDGAVAFMSSAA